MEISKVESAIRNSHTQLNLCLPAAKEWVAWAARDPNCSVTKAETIIFSKTTRKPFFKKRNMQEQAMISVGKKKQNIKGCLEY